MFKIGKFLFIIEYAKGVSDAREVIGVSNVDETMRRISDMITSQIEPSPQEIIHTELKFDDGKTLIVLEISKGNNNIYCIILIDIGKGRSDTSGSL